uniref:Chemokine interleukin-8-like domain-containing protein n=1 Tax=Erpetoichthys calabaricus TaxID=27687 RepID=A0A8C4SLS1_ERPCA
MYFLKLYIALYLSANASHVPDECCFSFYPKRLPIKSISHLKTTSSSCPVAGVILHVKQTAIMRWTSNFY